MNKVLLSSIACAMTLAVSGCALDQMSKSQIGTGAGAIIGGLIGQNNGGAVGALVGAAVGGGIGYLIGSDMDEEDRKALAEKTAQNIDTMQTGQTIAWKSERTGNEAVMKVARISEEQKSVSMPTASQIHIPANTVLLNASYQANTNATIYTETNINSASVGILPKGTVAKVVGKTSDGTWLIVSRKDTAIGFIQARQLTAYNAQPKVPTMTLQKAPPRTQEKNTTTVVDLDTLPAQTIAKSVKKPAFDLDAIEVKQQTAMVTTECKTLTYDINAKGKQSQETAKACKAPNGTWELG